MKNRLTKDFYNKNALLNAVDAYKSLASISISEDSNYYYYEVKSSIYEPQLVANEFENYVLGLMNT
ncbi:HxsD-like protein [Butyrivibrio sp.]|uniref:HxsD-like protein n=1 Tax=Butyrivibrio sp. TaxID=28121 RepID=UPI0025C10B22|nr:HxsD-like protein [Butyrivibrio sp.]MBE5837955.1 hypothetical protein [Butyrivibrio sp.]